MKFDTTLDLEALQNALNEALKQRPKVDLCILSPAELEALTSCLKPRPNGLQRAIRKAQRF